MKAYFSDPALRRSALTLERMIAPPPFEPYAGVYRQKWGLVRAVNEISATAGYDLIALICGRSGGERSRIGTLPVGPPHAGG